MKKMIKDFTVKTTVAILFAVTIMSTAAPVVARAEGIHTQVTASAEKATGTSTAKKVTGKDRGPVIDMKLYNTFLGYHGTQVDYEKLETGKFYLMQIPRRTKLPTFKFSVVKILGSYTNKGFIFDDVMVKFNKYDTNGKLVARNKETQVNTNLLNMTPNHFYEITDDILAK